MVGFWLVEVEELRSCRDMLAPRKFLNPWTSALSIAHDIYISVGILNYEYVYR